MLSKLKVFFASFIVLVGLGSFSLNAADLLDQNDFNNGEAGSWSLYKSDANNAEGEIIDGEYVLHVANGAANRWDIQFRHQGLVLEQGHTYTVKFKVRATADTQVYAKLGDAGPPYGEYWNNGGQALTLTAGQEVVIEDTFTMTAETAVAAEFAFHAGGELTGVVPFDIIFDDIYLEDPDAANTGNELLKQTDFENGKAIPWGVFSNVAGYAAGEVQNGEFALNINEGGENRWEVQFRHQNLEIEQGHTYTVSFKVRAEKDARIYAKIGMAGAPYTEYWNNNATPYQLAAGEERVITETFVMEATTDSNVEFGFHAGGDLTGPDAPYTIFFDDIHLTDPEYDGEKETGLPKPNVRINQLGYFPLAKKRATILNDSTDPVVWTLKNSEGQIVAAGLTTVFGEDAASGDFVHQADFSEYRTTGTDYTLVIEVEVDGESLEQASHTFDIRNDLYSQMKYQALEYFYHNRSGIAIEMPYAGSEEYTRPAGHPEDIMQTWPETGQDDYSLDVTGGWYDAGDHGKYVVNGGISVWTMQNQYERTLYVKGANRDFYADGKMNIPENTNGIPDILDEARWEIEMFLAMQVPEGYQYAGMVHHKAHDESWTGIPLAPHEDPKTRYLANVSTAATLNFAAVAAQASRLWKTLDPGFSQKCLIAAEKAWAAALENPDIEAPNLPSGGGLYGDRFYLDEFYWAACELFVTTGAKEYKEYIRNSQFYLVMPTVLANNETETASTGVFYWGDTQGLGSVTLALVPNKLTRWEKYVVRCNIVEAADKFAADIESEGYLLPMKATEDGYVWGSNSTIINNLMVAALAYDFSGDTKYLDVVTESMDYLLGRNAMDQSYVTGYGERPVENPHHRFWAKQANPNFPMVPAGVLSGGPNSGLQDPYVQSLEMEGTAPQKCFVDNYQSWSTNEITINWNAPFAWVTAFVDEKMVAPPLEVKIVSPVGKKKVKNGFVFIKAEVKGDVDYVEFYVNDNLVSYDEKDPFWGVWFSFYEGTYTLTAKAIGTDGEEAFSEPVVIKTKDSKALKYYLYWLKRRYNRYF